MKNVIKNFLFFLVVIFFTILLELTLKQLNIRDENIFLIFILAILLIIIETKKLILGILASIIFVLSFNFLYTEPYYSLKVSDGNYYISFLIFIIVAIIVDSLVLKLQNQISIINISENRIRTMYEFSNSFLNCKNENDAINIFIDNLEKYLKREICIIDVNNKFHGNKKEYVNINKVMKYSLERNLVVEKNEKQFESFNYVCFPIKSKIFDFGCMIIENSLTFEEKEFILNSIKELIVVLDKIKVLQEQETTRVQIEKEKFKSSLLRGLSHDLKTPLTMIQSGSEFLNESYNELNEEAKISIIKDIYKESCDLNDFVQNLLNMTLINEKKTIINKKIESVDEIFNAVSDKIEKRLNGKVLEIVPTENMLFIDTNATLFTQVLVNLIDNAIKHTKPKTKIMVICEENPTDLIFKVIDNGGGIDENVKDKIFDDFYSLTVNQDKVRSNGLGLSICKTIVEAHNGKIFAYNNQLGGATFEFNIPKIKKGE